jgi:hypothetical protein
VARDLLARVFVLLARNRGRGDVATVMPCRVQRQAAPAGADFQQFFTRLQSQFPAGDVELGA